MIKKAKIQLQTKAHLLKLKRCLKVPETHQQIKEEEEFLGN